MMTAQSKGYQMEIVLNKYPPTLPFPRRTLEKRRFLKSGYSMSVGDLLFLEKKGIADHMSLVIMTHWSQGKQNKTGQGIPRILSKNRWEFLQMLSLIDCLIK